jgi:hypothetical protein
MSLIEAVISVDVAVDSFVLAVISWCRKLSQISGLRTRLILAVMSAILAVMSLAKPLLNRATSLLQRT